MEENQVVSVAAVVGAEHGWQPLHELHIHIVKPWGLCSQQKHQWPWPTKVSTILASLELLWTGKS
jgi:hypothetical protein